MVRDDISEDIELRRVKIEKRSEIKIFWTKLILNFRKKKLSIKFVKKNFQFRKANPVHKTVRAIALDKEDDIGHEKNNFQRKIDNK